MKNITNFQKKKKKIMIEKMLNLSKSKNIIINVIIILKQLKNLTLIGEQ